MSTSVPPPVLTSTGYVIPEEADILSAVLADIDSAFGGRLNTSLSTPQGQLASSLAAIIADKDRSFLSYVNQVDPQYAQGRMQDAIAAIYFLTRIPARSTIVSCTCTGLENTVIPPATALAKDIYGNIYACDVGGTIDATGSIVLTFSNVVPGATPCPTGTLTMIYGTIPGWDTITNLVDGTLGNDVETPQAFETRRQASVAINAVGSVPSIFAAVAASGATLDPPNIPLDVYVTDNRTDVSMVVGGVSLLPHSVYVAVKGGNSDAIGAAIWRKASIGCNYNGNTTVTVEDTVGYVAPYPTYTVKYQVPDDYAIKFSVTIASNTQLPGDIETLIKAAIVAAFNGEDGGSRARIGGSIYASRFYAPVSSCATGVDIVSILVGYTAATSTSASVQIDQYPTITASDIQVLLI